MTITRDLSLSFPLSSTASTVHSWEANADSKFSRQQVLTRTRTGTRYPRWRKAIEDGVNCTTPLTATWDSLECHFVPVTSVDMQRWSGETVKTKCWGHIGVANNQRQVGPRPAVKDTSFCDNLARVAFYKKLHALETKFQGLTFLGELKESLHMLRRPARALWSSAEGYSAALNKAKRSNPKHWMKTIGGLWLEHSFGWLPLINDCKDAVKAYHALTSPKPHTYKLGGGARKEYDRTSELDEYFQAGRTLWINGYTHWTTEYAKFIEFHIVRYKGAMRATIEAPKWDNMRLFGFQPEEFIPTAWELLPWSFLADYFTNIGDLLSCLVTNTRNVAWVNRSVITETFFRGRMGINPQAMASFLGAGWSVTKGSSQKTEYVARRRTVSRTPGVGIPMPTLQFNIDLTDGQLGNVAALLAQSRALHPQSPRPLHRLPGM